MREERTQGARPLPCPGWSRQAFTRTLAGRGWASGFPDVGMGVRHGGSSWSTSAAYLPRRVRLLGP